MGIEIRAVGGYKEVGKNMTAIKVDDEVVIIDMGIHLPNYIAYTEDQEFVKLSERKLREAGAIPDDGLIHEWRDKVVAITTTHAHLDHIAAMPYMAGKYDCPIFATPFCIAVLKQMLRDEKVKLPNKFVSVKPNQTIKLSEKIELVFVAITHSIPEAVTIALRTPYGIITYSNDFKLDNNPVLGPKPNYKLLEKLSKEGVHASIINCLYAWNHAKTPSESVVKNMLADLLIHDKAEGHGIVITTFSSHIARLKTICEFGKRVGRKVVLLGRSMARYSKAAKQSGVYDFEGVEIVRFPRQVRRKLKEIQRRGKDKYLVVVTGHQGEPKAILSRLARGELPWEWDEDDYVIFSSQVIPSKINKEQSAILEANLKEKNIRIFRNVHVSGHASREDLRDFIKLLRPEHVIPSHGIPMMVDAMKDLCELLGMEEENIHCIGTGERLKL